VIKKNDEMGETCSIHRKWVMKVKNVWKFQYCVQLIPQMGSVVSHLNPFRTRTNKFFKIYLNIVLPSTFISLSYSGSSIQYFI